MLNKTDILFERNNDGQLVPQEIVLSTLEDKPVIKIIPLTRGQLQEIYSKAKSEDINERIKSDNSIIKLGLVEPKLSDEEIECLRPKYSTAIAVGILSSSLDIPQEEVNNKAQETFLNQELELKKK